MIFGFRIVTVNRHKSYTQLILINAVTVKGNNLNNEVLRFMHEKAVVISRFPLLRHNNLRTF